MEGWRAQRKSLCDALKPRPGPLTDLSAGNGEREEREEAGEA